jgi:cephalosporin hydroxylase
MSDRPTHPAVRAFEAEVAERIAVNATNRDLQDASARFMHAATVPKYSYNFTWLGRPIIQYPQDIVAMQELIWRVRPDLIVETGIAHGGSLILSASMLALLDLCDAIEAGTTIAPAESKRLVLGVDVEIRGHNRAAIGAHPLASRIQMIEGSSIDPAIMAKVRTTAAAYDRILVCLDSNHTHDHVLAELEAYAPLASLGSYCVVFDTVIEDLDASLLGERPWKPGDNPKTAVRAFLAQHPEFEIDASIHEKLLITVSPDGYLRRVS